MGVSIRTKILVPLFFLSIIPSILLYLHFTEHASLFIAIDAIKSFAWISELLLAVLAVNAVGFFWALLKREKILVPVFILMLIMYSLMYLYFVHGISLYTGIIIVKAQILRLIIFSKARIAAIALASKGWWLRVGLFFKNLTWRRGGLLVGRSFLNFFKGGIIKGAIKLGQLFALTGFIADKNRKKWLKDQIHFLKINLKSAWYYTKYTYIALPLASRVIIALFFFAFTWFIFSIDGLLFYLPKGVGSWLVRSVTVALERTGAIRFFIWVYSLMPTYIQDYWAKAIEQIKTAAIRAEKERKEKLEITKKVLGKTTGTLKKNTAVKFGAQGLGQVFMTVTTGTQFFVNTAPVKFSTKAAAYVARSATGAVVSSAMSIKEKHLSFIERARKKEKESKVAEQRRQQHRVRPSRNKKQQKRRKKRRERLISRRKNRK